MISVVTREEAEKGGKHISPQSHETFRNIYVHNGYHSELTMSYFPPYFIFPAIFKSCPVVWCGELVKYAKNGLESHLPLFT
jgi:hypothetical protein